MGTLFMQPLTNELEKNAAVMATLESAASRAVNEYLVDPQQCWQPTDFLPDMAREDAMEQVLLLRKRTDAIPPEVITSLVGNMITEEALPNYQAFFNLLKGVNEEGNMASENGWVQWSRSWTAEENRHGDLLNKYLYLSGRADMKAVEITIHNLIANGFDGKVEQDPYQAMIYTSFQERATKIAHVNTGKLAAKAGDDTLSRICKTIAGDEARHEKAYKSFMSNIFEIDPDGALLAFEKMMKKQITMPALLMDHATTDSLFTRFSMISEKMGIYTTFDYANIIHHLTQQWKIEGMTGLKDYAAKAQEYLCTLADRYRRIAERLQPQQMVMAPVWVR
ncbi:acyl-ACP desaturase [Lacibacter sp. H407]|uniref:acyl-ACP desaturase n=1 Tax=Lacibacter sp. H407 TaxID=3133423 RepID=UPI0030C52047